MEPSSGSAEGVSVVVPTFNERENLPELVARLDEALTSAGVPFEVVVVDDDSPDGTWREAEELAEEGWPVRSVRRVGESGLATAVVRGFREASFDRFVVMDADLQHPPERVPDLVAALEDHDVAVGSRFTEGGSVGSFGPLRRFISWTAEFLARTLFPRTRDVEDIQSGFFALHRRVVEDVELEPRGYKILLEVLVSGRYATATEVGYTFGERKRGASKLGVESVVDYLVHLVSLAHRSGELARMGRFLLVGGLGAVVNLLILHLLTTLGVHTLVAGAVAIEGGLLWNFLWNGVWTFQDRFEPSVATVLRALVRDHVVRSGGIALNLGTLWLLWGVVGLPALVAQGVGIALATAWNFSGNQWWTWEA